MLISDVFVLCLFDKICFGWFVCLFARSLACFVAAKKARKQAKKQAQKQELNPLFILPTCYSLSESSLQVASFRPTAITALCRISFARRFAACFSRIRSTLKSPS